MRFALLGDHPDGLAMARALVASGRHELLAYSGPAAGRELLLRWEITARPVGDVEEILADPALEGVIVAGKPADRAVQLRRALQSEHHVLCVHPADAAPDIAYEAAMIVADTRKTVLPLLAEALHPGVQRLAELVRGSPAGQRLIELERSSTEAVLLDADTAGHDPGVPGWDVLRLLGGEIVEIVGLARGEEMDADAPVLIAGRFEDGCLFRMTLLPLQAQPCCRWTVRTGVDRFEFEFPQGWPGPSRLAWHDEFGKAKEESWDNWDPWTALVRLWEEVVAGEAAWQIPWLKETRCLELDDGARRSIERRRASTLDYQEVTEKVGFKGTMTLVGCSLIWGSLVLLIGSVWLPWLAWGILPMFGIFLAMQVLRWVVPPDPHPENFTVDERSHQSTQPKL